jgi:hypothetical protein
VLRFPFGCEDGQGEELVLRSGEEALDDGIIPAIALPTHAHEELVLAEQGLVRPTAVLGGFNRPWQHLDE